MKITTTLILNLCFLTNVAFSQEDFNLPSLSKDTLTLLTGLNCSLGNHEKLELINTQSNIADSITGSRFDSTFTYSCENTSFKEEFSADGCYISVFALPGTINKIVNGSWIEIKEIRLNKHRILLMLILHKKTNSETTSILYKFKITYRPRKPYDLLNPRYRLIKKRPLTPLIQVN